MSQLQCILVTPEKTVLDGPAEFVALPLYDGEIGIAPLRAKMIGRLGYGELRIRAKDRSSRFYVEGGFVEVADDVVSVLTNRAIPAAELDQPALEEQLRTARERPARTAEQMDQRDRAVTLARAQLRVARRAE